MRCRGSGSPTGNLQERPIGTVTWAGALKAKSLNVVTCPVCCQHRESWWDDGERPTNFTEHEEHRG